MSRTSHNKTHSQRLMLMLSLFCAGCLPTTDRWSINEEIVNALTNQAAAWNAGDIGAFMEPYWHSPELTFSSGGRVTRGWEATLANYRERYPTREAMGHLTFTDLEVTRLDDKAALVLGRWKLEREEPIGGTFTLVLRRDAGRWTIVHDHTSRDSP